MHYFPHNDGEFSDWSNGAGQRLRASMLASAAVLFVVASFLRIPEGGHAAPIIELVVNLVNNVSAPAENPPVEVPAAVEPLPTAEKTTALPQEQDQTASATTTPDSAGERPIDWQQQARIAVRDTIDSSDKTYYVNLGFEEKRQQAAIQFRPSEAPRKKPIWENVEKDQLGRTILRSGNCYRVLDDPRVTNRWAFETFGQYMTYCSPSDETYLIEIDRIPGRYDYLEESGSE